MAEKYVEASDVPVSGYCAQVWDDAGTRYLRLYMLRSRFVLEDTIDSARREIYRFQTKTGNDGVASTEDLITPWRVFITPSPQLWIETIVAADHRDSLGSGLPVSGVTGELFEWAKAQVLP